MNYKFAILFFFFLSCNTKCDSEIKINDLVLYYSDNANFQYCNYVKKCLAGDKSSLKIMFGQSRDFLDGETSYMDCFNVVQMTKLLGEEKVIGLIDDFSEHELKIYYNKLEAGLDYSSDNRMRVSEYFPIFQTYYDSVFLKK